MSAVHIDPMLQVETTCGSLLYELQVLTSPSLRTDELILSFIYFPSLLFFTNLHVNHLFFDTLNIFWTLC